MEPSIFWNTVRFLTNRLVDCQDRAKPVESEKYAAALPLLLANYGKDLHEVRGAAQACDTFRQMYCYTEWHNWDCRTERHS